jgi:hypothetical protein
VTNLLVLLETVAKQGRHFMLRIHQLIMHRLWDVVGLGR